MCVCICVRVLSKTVTVSIPDAGSTMEPEQRDVSHGLSTADGSATGLSASGGSNVHKVKDATFKLILASSLKPLERNMEWVEQEGCRLKTLESLNVRSAFHLSETPKIYRYKVILTDLKATFADLVNRRALIQNDHTTQNCNELYCNIQWSLRWWIGALCHHLKTCMYFIQKNESANRNRRTHLPIQGQHVTSTPPLPVSLTPRSFMFLQAEHE